MMLKKFLSDKRVSPISSVHDRSCRAIDIQNPARTGTCITQVYRRMNPSDELVRVSLSRHIRGRRGVKALKECKQKNLRRAVSRKQHKKNQLTIDCSGPRHFETNQSMHASSHNKRCCFCQKNRRPQIYVWQNRMPVE